VREERKALAAAPRKTPPPRRSTPAKPSAPSKNQVRQAAKIEAEIAVAEAALAGLEQELADPTAWNDPRSARKSTALYEEARRRVETLYDELAAVAT